MHQYVIDGERQWMSFYTLKTYNTMIQYYISSQLVVEKTSEISPMWIFALWKKFLWWKKPIMETNDWINGNFVEDVAYFDVYEDDVQKWGDVAHHRDYTRIWWWFVYLEKPYIEFTARERQKIRNCITKYFRKQNLTMWNFGMKKMDFDKDLHRRWFWKKTNLKQHIYQ